MKTETIENILNFIKEKESKEPPKSWFDSIEKLKLIEELENHPDGVQYKYEDHLYLNESKVKKLPNDLYVDGNLELYKANQLKELPSKLYVEGDLLLTDCKQLRGLSKYLYVGGDLYLYKTSLADKYTDEQIRDIVTSTGGEIVGIIFR
jgi:hypothetical protein